MVEQKKIIPGQEFPVDGLVFRTFAGEEDIEKMIAIHSACREADDLGYVLQKEELELGISNPQNVPPSQGWVIAEVSGKAVAYSQIFWLLEEPSKDRVYCIRILVHPHWRGRGIRHALLKHNEALHRKIAAGLPPEEHRIFQIFCRETEEEAIRLYQENGYHPERYFYDMIRPDLEDIPDLSLPEGVEVREVKPEHYRKVWETDVEAFKDHWGYTDQTDEDYQRWLKWQNLSPDLWQVAWYEDEIVGQIQNFIDTGENETEGCLRGHTEDICVREAWRKKGIASALIARSLKVLKNHGMKEAALGVDSDNATGALKLYQRMGFQVVRQLVVLRKPF